MRRYRYSSSGLELALCLQPPASACFRFLLKKQKQGGLSGRSACAKACVVCVRCTLFVSELRQAEFLDASAFFSITVSRSIKAIFLEYCKVRLRYAGVSI